MQKFKMNIEIIMALFNIIDARMQRKMISYHRRYMTDIIFYILPSITLRIKTIHRLKFYETISVLFKNNRDIYNLYNLIKSNNLFYLKEKLCG